MPTIEHPTYLPSSSRSDSNFKGPRGQLKYRCGLCHQTRDKLSICTGCKAVRYCSKEHQVEDRLRHKVQCCKVKKYRTKLAKEEDLVRNATPDFMTPANAFETDVGHFWGILSTRDYMRARFALADLLRRIGTLDGVTEALDHLRDMIRLCRSDNMGVRDIIPILMLQLDKDQESYDFIKWYETEGQRSDYNWGDITLPFLNTKNANTLENVDFMDRKYGSLNHVVTVMLLKIKLMVDCSTIRLARQVLAGRVPLDLWRNIERFSVRSPISVRFTLYNSRQLAIIEDDLALQIKHLGHVLQKTNDGFLTGLLDPNDYLHTRPQYYSAGSMEEMMIALQNTYPVWWQHEGVLELLQSAKDIAAKDSDIEIDDMMASLTFKQGGGSDRTRAELLDDVSRNRLWGYVDWAIEDSRNLLKVKPSDRHMQRNHEIWKQAEEDEV